MQVELMGREWFSTHPLPAPDPSGDKQDRGVVLVVGGSPQTPGAVLLAGQAALRSGAGKLRLATVPEVAQNLAVAVPEARVFDDLRAERLEPLRRRAEECTAVLVGPGMLEKSLAGHVVDATLPVPGCLLIDAMALFARDLEVLQSRRGSTVLTPNSSEAATMLGVSQDAVERDRCATVIELSRRSGSVVALKGSATLIAAPDGRLMRNHGGNPGLATSGSGDVLAGIILGLLARGGDPFEATGWAVHLHALAGDRLAETVGPIGFLARELSPQIPALMAELEGGPPGKSA